MKTNVYVDGFNLYYGIRDKPNSKWLDILKLCNTVYPKNQINRIRYFTALVMPRPNDPTKVQRQQTFIRALETIPILTVHYGHFLSSTVMAMQTNPALGERRFVEVHKTEEKGSDVNLATYLLLDALDKDFEAAIIVSNDSDLAEPITVVRRRFGLPVALMNPQKFQSKELLKVASYARTIRAANLTASQFPPTLSDANGVITKPVGW